jgi:diguanylate cyclase
MPLHWPTLLYVCTTVVTASAVAMSVFGRTQRVYKGFGWWTLAQWLLAAGLFVHAFADQWSGFIPIAHGLLLQWPIVVLGGMRRFHARHPLKVPSSVDVLMLALSFWGCFLTWWASGSLVVQIVAFCLSTMAVHLYNAACLTRLSDFRSSSAQQALVAAELVVVAIQGLQAIFFIVSPPSSEVSLPAVGIPVVASALGLAFLSLLFTYERTEGNLRTVHRKLRFLADIDVVTRVPNRRYFYEQAKRSLRHSKTGISALLMFDIDHFKQINDLLGHAAGDEALRQVARCVRDTLRERDVAGRLGGDEFAVLLPETLTKDALTVAERITIGLQAQQVVPQMAPISLSFGVVQIQINESIENALRRADQALYEAKRKGRGCAVTAQGDEAQPVFSESCRLGLTAS